MVVATEEALVSKQVICQCHLALKAASIETNVIAAASPPAVCRVENGELGNKQPDEAFAVGWVV